MAERKQKPLAILEAKVRQLMLMIGLGFMAMVGGLIFSTSLDFRLKDRLESIDGTALRIVIGILIERLWILFVFPVMLNLASRFLELPLWRAAILGALTGELFSTAVQYASTGFDGVLGDWRRDLVHGGTLVAGVCFAVWAGKQGRAWAEGRQKLADVAAAGRKAQYDEFLAASTALANKREGSAAAVPAPAEAAATEPKPEG